MIEVGGGHSWRFLCAGKGRVHIERESALGPLPQVRDAAVVCAHQMEVRLPGCSLPWGKHKHEANRITNFNSAITYVICRGPLP